MLAQTSTSATFRLFGFPVHVRSGFIIFMVLIALVNGSSDNPTRGLLLAGAIAAFTLLHELGHAVAARSAGCRAEIALDFLAGYASYIPNRPLARWERAGIAAAGPGIQIALGFAVLYAMGVDPFTRDEVLRTDASFVVWWAGPIIGLLNLIPVLPLDGGNILSLGIDKVAPGRGRTIVLYLSLPVTAVGTVLLATSDRLLGLVVFPAILLISQLQELTHRSDGERAQKSAAAEQQAWSTGDRRSLRGGTESPWLMAHLLVREGRTDDARAVLVGDLTTPNGTTARWRSPDTAPLRDLEALVALLPRPLPAGNAYSELVLLGILVKLGAYDDAARYGAECYTRTPTTVGAVQVARSVAALGDADLTGRWLQAGVTSGSPAMVIDVIDNAPELHAVRHTAVVQAARQAAVAARA